MKPGILHITPDFNYACGRSYYVFEVLKYLKSKNYKVMLLTDGGDSLERLDDHGIQYEVVSDLHSKGPLSYFRNLKLIRNISRDHNFKIIHTHHRYSELLAVQASKNRLNGGFSTVFTALSIVNRKYSLEYKSDRIIAVSNTVKKMLTDRFSVPEDKIRLIHNFTDTDEIHEMEILSQMGVRDHGETYNILSIGRFHDDKNFDILLQAVDELCDSGIKLILVGEGRNYSKYEAFIKRHRLNAELILPQKDLLQYFNIADLCVLPSSRDPFPNFMLQCGLHKRPFIGANVDGIAELIKDGSNGLLFPSGNSSELASRIKFLKNDKALADRFAAQLYSDVINNYTQEFKAPLIEKVYNELGH